jgi:hypothetical protein
MTTLAGTEGCTIGTVVEPPSVCANYITEVQFQYEVGLTGASCGSVGGCIPYEPNVVQTLGTITYGPNTIYMGTTDVPTTVTFEYTPEPGLYVALGIGLASMAVRRRLTARHRY